MVLITVIFPFVFLMKATLDFLDNIGHRGNLAKISVLGLASSLVSHISDRFLRGCGDCSSISNLLKGLFADRFCSLFCERLILIFISPLCS